MPFYSSLLNEAAKYKYIRQNQNSRGNQIHGCRAKLKLSILKQQSWTFHDCRITYCAELGFYLRHLLIKGVDVKTVSRLLGHYKTSTTLNIYAAITKEGYDKAESVLNGKTPVTVPDSE